MNGDSALPGEGTGVRRWWRGASREESRRRCIARLLRRLSLGFWSLGFAADFLCFGLRVFGLGFGFRLVGFL
ncbi:hypothetical protein ERO13_D09G098900v2 [Gossypium hirsutum]|uniref:Uncharacterized protein n=2 Tax=Gossypium TaxID=3633 RepID=A0A5D2TJE0_GOSMU|nr:hypothetical protein ERO13_D09G098900v2 [Gossypium hirsutum]TYG53642.1 hypothetical protein ES288_D09G125900v1 [Gossypium darwinii]TYI64845.1 hypothetical protein E1A91_D09G117300v1 [Gossypium mustelinum]